MGKVKKTNNDDLTGEIAPVVVKQITPEEAMIELGIPVGKKSQPDMLNNVPKRHVPLKEAQERGISWWWDGSTACKYGHVAAHRTSNHKICSDCFRVKNGQEPIYGKSRFQKFYNLEKKPPADPNTATAAAPAQSLGLSASDTKFLAAYAELRDLDKAAKAVGTTKELILARRVGFPGLDEAMGKLEQQLEIAKYMPLGAGFVWTDAARALFIDVYVNSGELEAARKAVGCTRAQYFAELKGNVEFNRDVDAARSLAESVVEEALIRSAIAGQQSVLPKVAELMAERASARNRDQWSTDPNTVRAGMQAMLDEMKKKRNATRVLRVKATGAFIEYKNIEDVRRDTSTGLLYKPDELEEVAALLLNLARNAAAQAPAIDSTAAERGPPIVADEEDEDDLTAPEVIPER